MNIHNKNPAQWITNRHGPQVGTWGHAWIDDALPNEKRSSHIFQAGWLHASRTLRWFGNPDEDFIFVPDDSLVQKSDTARELATILAALRAWQERYGQHSQRHLHIASNLGKCKPLSSEEIDKLCAKLNTAPLSGIWLEDVPDGSEHEPPQCPTCDTYMVLRRGRLGYFWGCTAYPDCQLVHRATFEGKPLGVRPIDPQDHYWQREAHSVFDALWRGSQKEMSRTEAYDWFRQVMELDTSEGHIKHLTPEQCQELIQHVRRRVKRTS